MGHIEEIFERVKRRDHDQPEFHQANKLDKESGSRVLTEMIKQGLISLTVKGYALTPLGKWYSAQQKPKPLSGVNKQ